MDFVCLEMDTCTPIPTIQQDFNTPNIDDTPTQSSQSGDSTTYSSVGVQVTPNHKFNTASSQSQSQYVGIRMCPYKQLIVHS